MQGHSFREDELLVAGTESQRAERVATWAWGEGGLASLSLYTDTGQALFAVLTPLTAVTNQMAGSAVSHKF